MTNYSNPRMRAVVENWPASGTKRVTATFEIEVDPKRGERATRTTTGAIKIFDRDPRFPELLKLFA